MKVLIICLVLTGCATHQITQTQTISGKVVIAHVDTFDAPDACGRSHLHGCHQRINGVDHVWYSEASPAFFHFHEVEGHAEGMEHGPYARLGVFSRDLCAKITVGNKHYPEGKLVCNDGKKEYFLDDGRATGSAYHRH